MKEWKNTQWKKPTSVFTTLERDRFNCHEIRRERGQLRTSHVLHNPSHKSVKKTLEQVHITYTVEGRSRAQEKRQSKRVNSLCSGSSSIYKSAKKREKNNERVEEETTMMASKEVFKVAQERKNTCFLKRSCCCCIFTVRQYSD